MKYMLSALKEVGLATSALKEQVAYTRSGAYMQAS
jgi:hypothetical protein